MCYSRCDFYFKNIYIYSLKCPTTYYYSIFLIIYICPESERDPEAGEGHDAPISEASGSA